MRTLMVAVAVALALTAASQGGAQEAVELDRVVVRWHARATGGTKKPQFITARELAFAARLEALSEGAAPEVPFSAKQLEAAIQRHVTETVLARLPVDPEPTPKEVARYAEAARGMMARTIGDGDAAAGRAAIDAARRAEGITNEELDTMLRLRARASWYLDKMVAPMLEPSELDLREVHRAGETPFTAQRFEDIEPALRQWYVSSRMSAALDQYYRTLRTRVDVTIIGQPAGKRGRGRPGGRT
jgi:hypothetical protein